MGTKTISFRQLFTLLFILFAGLLAASALSAWTGPAATAPGSNVVAPINAGTIDQVKNAGLSVNALTVFGSEYIQNKLGIGNVSPAVALDVNGTIKIGNAGELCQAVSAGALRYNSSSNVMEFCNGTAWATLGGQSSSVTPGYALYSTPGTYTFTVPAQFNNLTVTVLAGGGGGGGPYPNNRSCAWYGTSGGAGGDSSFNQSIVAYGGGGGQGGGDTLLEAAPAVGAGGGGAGGTVTTGGGGAGGAGTGGQVGACVGGAAGGNGGKTVQTFTPATLTANTLVSVIVGGGGAGASPGVTGANGLVLVFWQ